jgi:mannose-1-phosphate guanylyltransferase / mannose-6-phosphate isomerase
MLIPVIISGGAGARLWPVSRKQAPKPFMRVGDDSLLAATFKRAAALSEGKILTITAASQSFSTEDCFRTTDPNAAAASELLLEPMGRNTAGAIALAALAAVEHAPEAILLVMPADHLIQPQSAFVAAAHAARQVAEQDYLVTFGIAPTRPETGFGYLLRGAPIAGTAGFELQGFVEKPDLATAQQYLASGDYWWNGGMFCFRARALLAELATHDPQLLATCQQAHAHSERSGAQRRYQQSDFAAIRDISIDYAVMEKSKRVATVPAAFDWSDIGAWPAVAAAASADKADAHANVIEGECISVAGSRNNYVRSQRLVSLVGVSDLVVVETPDAVLVAHKDQAQQVKAVVDQLNANKDPRAELHTTVTRPWGSYTVLEDAADCKVKRLVVRPGQVLSLQLHHRRAEHWTVVQGIATVTIGETVQDLRAGQACYIPVNTKHRLENRTAQDIHLIEVQCGDYFGEDDIVRFEDRYGRR